MQKLMLTKNVVCESYTKHSRDNMKKMRDKDSHIEFNFRR